MIYLHSKAVVKKPCGITSALTTKEVMLSHFDYTTSFANVRNSIKWQYAQKDITKLGYFFKLAQLSQILVLAA